MSAQPVVAFAVPNGAVAAQFTAGELAIGPSTGAVAAGTYHLAKRLYLKSGVYQLKVWGDDSVTAWIGDAQISARRIGVVPAGNTTVTFEFFAQEGVHRIDLTLVNATLGQSYAAVSLTSNGQTLYTSTAAGWVWDTTPIPDADVPSVGDERLFLPVWTVSPEWSQGITERLSWLTEIMTSERAVEQRRTLRRFPRRSFEVNFLRAGVSRQRIDNFISGVGAGRFLAPIWPERLRLPGALSGATVTWPADTLTYREFYAGELALLCNDDPAIYEVVSIQSVSDSTLTLTAAPTRTWPASTRITPLRVARFEEPAEQQMITDRVATTTARFTLAEPERYITPSWGYCAPLWRFQINRAEALSIDHTRQTYTIDVDTGVVDITDPSGRDAVGMKAQLSLFGRERLWAFRSFLAEARGRAVRFWWPSGTHDLEPVGVIGGVTLDVADTGYAEWMTQPQDSRLMIGIVFADGRATIYRRIQYVQQMSSFDRLTLTLPVPAVDREDIERVMFMVPVRFDQDGFELQHVTDNAKAVLASVVVRSSTIEGMPDIDCWVTSRPYPVFEVDDLSVSGTITGGHFGGMLPQILALDVGGTIVGGSFPITVIYTPTGVGPEALDVSGTITGGSFPITVLYRAYEGAAEALDMASTVAGGTMTIALISTVIDTEALSMNGSIIGGTLQ